MFPLQCQLLLQEQFEYTKGQSESVYERRTNSTMANRKRTNNNQHNIHIKQRSSNFLNNVMYQK